MCKARRLQLRREARDGISARNSVSCQSQRYSVTGRGRFTRAYPPYDEAADEKHDLPTLSTYTCVSYISNFDGQNVT